MEVLGWTVATLPSFSERVSVVSHADVLLYSFSQCHAMLLLYFLVHTEKERAVFIISSSLQCVIQFEISFDSFRCSRS